jgi:hypothetical protein
MPFGPSAREEVSTGQGVEPSNLVVVCRGVADWIFGWIHDADTETSVAMSNHQNDFP